MDFQTMTTEELESHKLELEDELEEVEVELSKRQHSTNRTRLEVRLQHGRLTIRNAGLKEQAEPEAHGCYLNEADYYCYKPLVNLASFLCLMPIKK